MMAPSSQNRPEPDVPDRDDPVLRNARREGLIIIAAWAAATLYCCTYYYLFGTIRPGRPLDRADVHPSLGMPSWFVWGVLLPWGLCGAFTAWFAGFVMADDDLGADHAADLEGEIRAGGPHE